MIKFTGDFAALQRFADRLAKTPAILPVITRNMAEEAVELVKQGFQDQRDPHGKPWAPKVIEDGRAILTGQTSRLRNGWHVAHADADGFRVAPSVTYAIFHQKGRGPVRAKSAKALRFRAGGGFMFRKSVGPAPARKMVPDRGKLPSVWQRHMVAAAREVLTDHFGG